MTSYRPSGVGGGTREEALPDTVVGSGPTASLEFSPWPSEAVPHFIDEVQRGEGTRPRSHRRCAGQSILQSVSIPQSHTLQREKDLAGRQEVSGKLWQAAWSGGGAGVKRWGLKWEGPSCRNAGVGDTQDSAGMMNNGASVTKQGLPSLGEGQQEQGRSQQVCLFEGPDLAGAW